MGKVKGLVLESDERHVILLTREGEYLRLPARGRLYEPGSEGEFSRPSPFRHARAFGLVAGLILLLLSTLLWHNQPRAYLALDINPSLTLVLNSRARVVRAQGHNFQGTGLLESLDLRGFKAREALEAILEESLSRGHLSTEEKNMVFLSLAGSPGFRLEEQDLQAWISQALWDLQVDAYLWVARCSAEKGREALGREISLNAQLLGEQLQAEGGKAPDLPGPPGTIRDFIRTFNPDFTFSEEDFIPGKAGERGRPETPAPPGQTGRENKKNN